MRPILKLPEITPSSSLPSKVKSPSSCGITKRIPPSACSSALKARFSILRVEMSNVPQSSPSASCSEAFIGTSDRRTLITPSQSPISAASGPVGAGVGVGEGTAVGAGVGRGEASGRGDASAVGVGTGVAVGAGEGITVGDTWLGGAGVGERTAVGVGGAGRGVNNPHALSKTAAKLSATGNKIAGKSARKPRGVAPQGLDGDDRDDSFRLMPLRWIESVTGYYFTIAHFLTVVP